MRFLLDTHVWLWLLESPQRITASVLAQLGNADELVLSVATVWEIAIKTKLGKLRSEAGLEALREEILRESDARELVITSHHAIAAAGLPLMHRAMLQRWSIRNR